MKKSTIISAFTAILAFGRDCSRSAEQKLVSFYTYLIAALMMAVTPAFAQEEHGFKKFNVREDSTENGFQWFHDAELLAAGDKEKSNAMTIGWGGIGIICFWIIVINEILL